MRIMSWNINGIRAAERKGFLRWFRSRGKADIVGLQEVRAELEQIPSHLLRPKGYVAHWFSATRRRGYSGVGVYSRVPPISVETSLGEERFDVEGRMLGLEYERFILYNVYFPKGSGVDRDNSRVPYKLEFTDAVIDHALRRRKKLRKPLVIMGDFNTAHREIDLRNPRTNHGTSGFLPEERANLERNLRRGFVDTFRYLHPDKVQYTWWSQRIGVRERNIGWRIDYVWVSEELAPHLKKAFIQDDVRGSDHCPLGIEVEWK
ncbi:MAG: exodeoxyribonuclease III [Myxococcota bacterium]